MAMGGIKASLVLDSELREQLERLASSRSSGQDYLAERFWEDRRGDCVTTGDEQGHDKSVAVPIPRARRARTL